MNYSLLIDRLKEILAYYGLSSSAFAEKIDIQRSSVSHLLSGRNKPSLDFVTKVVENFPEVDLYWLLYGQGSFPNKKNEITPPITLFDQEKEKTTKDRENNFEETKKINTLTKKKITKVVLLYDDNTFEEFNP